MFEVVEFPESELEYWSLFFSIDENDDKPIVPKLTLTERKAKFKGMFK